MAIFLKRYQTKNFENKPIILADSLVKSELANFDLQQSNLDLSNTIKDLIDQIQALDKNLRTNLSQIYKQNSVDLNCKRHMSIFYEKNIIPQFCFGCFKVQVEVMTVIDLIRVTGFFYDNSFFPELTKKCMIEMRPDIRGNYKGLIYCRGLSEAQAVKTKLNSELKRIDESLEAKVKRGCSEFPLVFPEYDPSNGKFDDMMQYPADWKILEDEFDKSDTIHRKTFSIQTLDQFCLSDILIIQKWIDYGKGIGDPTANLFSSLPVKYPETFQIAKNRVADI